MRPVPKVAYWRRSILSCIGLFWCGSLLAQDTELTNYKSGINVTWGGVKGTDYYEEYFYHDKLLDDHKVVYLRQGTDIIMSHNERNNANYHVLDGGRQVIGANGKDGATNTGDEGLIRYRIDRDRQYGKRWSQNFAMTDAAQRYPAYSGPFALEDLTFETGIPVVGTTGPNGGAVSSKTGYYYRGILDSFGDEWHVLSYADDDDSFLRLEENFVDQAYYASDGKTVLLVVNPKTPCFTARATGSGQFYTTPPKAYFTPKVVPQTTYISGTVSIELRDINGNNVFYRINGGTYTDAGGPTVTLNQDNFTDGQNTLEYYYAGNQAFTKTRMVVKNPGYPSASEAHGNYLWENTEGLSRVLARITRAPYLGYYTTYRNRGDFSGQFDWDAKAGRGLRVSGSNGVTYALKNAFVAKVEGYGFTRSGASKSHGQYAKEMIMETSRTIDPLGFELNHSSDGVPARELHYRGYYDSLPILDALFAYDILIANFRSDQVSGGITPVEDYFIRDHLANFAYEAMQWTADMTGLGSPGMWGGARILAATSIGMILREYSTPYYGTSGFGTVQTTYPLCPYETDRLTWKQAMFDGTAPKSGYPNLTWYAGLSDNGPGNSLFLGAGELAGARPYPLGTWGDKAAYFSNGLMGIHLQIWANMAKLWGGGRTDPRLEIAFESASKGLLIGTKDPFPQTPARYTNLLQMNSRWPNLVTNAFAVIQALPSSDNNSDEKALQDMGVWGFAWYDDQQGGSVDPEEPPPPPPPPPPVNAPSNARVNISISGS